MIWRKFTLNTKECNYISRNHKTIHSDDFVIFGINQYPNRKYNQHSIQLSTKLAKSSVHRHLIKRHFINMIQLYIYQNYNLTSKSFWKYLRIPKKETIPKFETILQDKDKISLKNKIKKILEHNIQQFSKKTI